MKEKLIQSAKNAAKTAIAPYSGFKVGSALLCEDGSIYTGCNIENSSYSATVCAERVAFFKALSEGKRAFKAIAIVGGRDEVAKDACYPCGVCCQVMSEFCDINRFQLILPHGDGCLELLLSDVFPNPFALKE